MHDTASIYFLLYLNYRVIMDLLRRQLAVALQHAMEPWLEFQVAAVEPNDAEHAFSQYSFSDETPPHPCSSGL